MVINRIAPLFISHSRIARKTACSIQQNNARRFLASSSANITYSGGQATEGQGGFYGSGGARVIKPLTHTEHRPELLALVEDVEKVRMVMDELHNMEQLLQDLVEKPNGQIAGESIEMKAKIQKLCTNPEFTDCLNRLEIKGEPVWGLSGEERDMIVEARNKVNAC